MKKIKLSIIGSCMTREMFTTENNKNYKKFYELGKDMWQISIVSLMSKPIVEIDIPSDLAPFKRNYLIQELDKSLLETLKNDNPEYILFDLYADVRYGYLGIDERYCTNNPTSVRKSEFYCKKENYTFIYSLENPDEHLSIFKEGFSKFVQWKEKNLPNTKLILNKFRYADYYLDEQSIKQAFDENRFVYLESDLSQYNRMEEYIQANYEDILIFDNSTLECYGNGAHKYGITPWHLTKNYFEDSMHVFHELILTDKKTMFFMKRGKGILDKLSYFFHYYPFLQEIKHYHSTQK